LQRSKPALAHQPTHQSLADKRSKAALNEPTVLGERHHRRCAQALHDNLLVEVFFVDRWRLRPKPACHTHQSRAQHPE